MDSSLQSLIVSLENLNIGLQSLNLKQYTKHQRHINQVQTTEETTSHPPGVDDTESNELQLNHINYESSDTESDTDNTISVNMITVENDYEPIIY